MKTNRSFLPLALLIAVTLCRPEAPLHAQQTPAPASTVAELQQRLERHISAPRFAAADWGVKIVSLDTGKVLFENRPEKLFQPASNSKLYTCALALDRLGEDHRIETSLYAKERPNWRGTLKGDLVVYGRGDPTFNTKLHNGDIFKALEPLVAALTNVGVKRITGDLVGDDSYLPGPSFGSGWTWDDPQYYYGAELSALTLNDNILALTVKPGAKAGAPCELTLAPATVYAKLINHTKTVEAGGRAGITLYRPVGGNVTYVSGQLPLDSKGYNDDVTIHNPAGLFVEMFKEALKKHGIKVSGKPRTVGWKEREANPVDYSEWVELGLVESPPMRTIVREIQKPSQNLYTDLLLGYVGVNSDSFRPGMTAEDAGIRELYKFLEKAGIPASHVRFEEGSGLSRNNLTTPNATIKLLKFMHDHETSDAYLKALPIAGVDGTIRRRMQDTAAQGNVRAKTGTLRWANSLSGHVTTAAGEKLLFSIMLNRYYNTDPNRSARSDIDAIAVMLAEFKGHSSK